MARIIIIDDEKLIRELMRTQLERAGYEVRVAENGVVGADLYRLFPSDLIITDIFMPEKDGVTTIQELVQEFPKVKIIAMTGGGSILPNFDYLKHAQLLGAIHTFKKPINSKELLSVINQLLG